jgi:uncharacterized repeat protein (TIGR01451 family)
MGRRAVLLLMAMTAFGALIASPASAHPSPVGCRANGIDLTLGKSVDSPSVLRQGDTITFLVAIANTNNVLGVPCDVTGAKVGMAPPTPDGKANLDPAAPSTPVVTNQSYPSLFAAKQIGSISWVVNLNPTVEYAYALARVSGILHDTAQDSAFADVVKTIGFQVSNPKLSISKVGSIQQGQAPQNVTYTYVVRNDSTTPVPMNNVVVSDDKCANPTYVGGDNGDALLSNGEAWTYTCTSLLQAAGVYTNTASACAHSTVPGDTTRPVCTPPVTWTVTLTAPPPKGAVKAASACLSVASQHLKVRAREINTVRVRVRVNGKNIARSKVKIHGPAGLKKTGVTNRKGMVTFVVRPKKSGRLTITSDKCAVKARVSVKPARRVVAPALPEVTG